MVVSLYDLQFSLPVLYAQKDDVWKIADFGLMTEGTSLRLRSTSSSRGTSGYRAPELLGMPEDPRGHYNNKADTWSMGCILYELTTGRRLFVDDWKILEYILLSKRRPETTRIEPEKVGPVIYTPAESEIISKDEQNTFYATLCGALNALLVVDQSERMSSRQCLDNFTALFMSLEVLVRSIHQNHLDMIDAIFKFGREIIPHIQVNENPLRFTEDPRGTSAHTLEEWDAKQKDKVQILSRRLGEIKHMREQIGLESLDSEESYDEMRRTSSESMEAFARELHKLVLGWD